jgi:hypothetical protein
MLRYFTLFDLLSERCAVAGAVAPGAADFLCAFGHGVVGRMDNRLVMRENGRVP